MTLYRPRRLAETAKIIAADHLNLTETNIIQQNRDYRVMLKDIQNLSDSELLLYGRKLPIHRLNFLALAILDENLVLRQKILFVLQHRIRPSFLILLFPHLPDHYQNQELIAILNLGLEKGLSLGVDKKKEADFKSIFAAANPPSKAADILLKRREQLVDFLLWSSFPPSSEFVHSLTKELMKRGEKRRFESEDMDFFLPTLNTMSEQELFSFLKRYCRRIDEKNFRAEVAEQVFDRFGPPDAEIHPEWLKVDAWTREKLRRLQVNQRLQELIGIASRFATYQNIAPRLLMIKIHHNLNLVFLIGRNTVAVEPINGNMDGALLSRDAFYRSLRETGLSTGQVIFRNPLILKRLSSDQDERDYVIPGILNTYFKPLPKLKKLKKNMQQFWARLFS